MQPLIYPIFCYVIRKNKLAKGAFFMAYNFKEIEKNDKKNGIAKVLLMQKMITLRKNGMD